MPLLHRYHNRHEDGFTLIELLIVVLIIGVLAAIAIPVYLGIQAQGYKSAVRADVNLSVKRIQVGMTEGASLDTIKSSTGTYTQRSLKGEVVSIGASPSGTAGANDYSVTGVVSTSSTPQPGPINYTYAYDSVTGKFSELNSGSALPSVTITTASLPAATVQQAYSQQINATVANPTATTAYTATGLPAWLNLNATTGLLSGTPTATGTANITITVTNGSVSDSKAYTLNVYSVPTVTTSSLPAGIATQSYSQTLTATGTPTPTFDFAPGSNASNLPAGLTLDKASGTISGTLSASAATSTFSVVATNGGGTSTPVPLTIVVNTLPAITTSTLPNAVLNTQYSQTLTATGSPAPTFVVTSGSFPAGISFNTSTGLISGTPTASGPNTVTIKATNAAGDSSPITFALPVYETPAVTNVSLSDLLIGSGAVKNFNVTGYPTGTLSGVDNFPACVIPATDNTYRESGCTAPGIYGVSVQASNAAGAGPVSTYLINVRSVTTPDLLSNNFSGGTSGWVAQSGSPSISTGTVDSFHGSSLRFTSNATTAAAARTATVTLTGGHNYAFESYVNLRSGDSARLCAFRPSDGFTYCSPTSITAKNTWSVVATSVNLTGTGSTDFSFYVEVAGSGAKDIYVDESRIFALN